MELFEKIYKDKIWIIDSSIGKSERISVSPTRFFHLMGLDEKDFRNHDSMKTFESVFHLKMIQVQGQFLMLNRRKL